MKTLGKVIREVAEEHYDAHRVRKGCGALAVTLHEHLLATLKSNPQWEYAFALGYVFGKFDAQDKKKSEHDLSESDDYALGYHKGYSEGLKNFAL